MVVCKYYLQGNCRYGDNCKFDHPQVQSNQYNNQNYQNQNKYKYVSSNLPTQQIAPPSSSNLFSKLVSTSGQQQQQQQPVPAQQQPTQTKYQIEHDQLTDQDFLNCLIEDFKTWLGSSYWKLSCYTYTRAAPILPLLEDISPEEVQYSLFLAKKNNRFQEEFLNFQNKYKQIIETIKQLTFPNQNAKEYLLNYFHESEKIRKSTLIAAAQSQTTSPSQSTNPFVLLAQQKQQFQQQQPQQQQQQFQQQQQPLFQVQPQLPIKNFLQQQQTNQIQSTGTFLFTNQNQQNNPSNSNLFSQLVSGQAQSSSNAPSFNTSNFQTTNGLFNIPKSSNIPQQQQQQQQSIPNPMQNFTQFPPNNFQNMNNQTAVQPQAVPTGSSRVYSDVNDLNEQDVTEFRSNQFTLGRIPHNPPTRELCL